MSPSNILLIIALILAVTGHLPAALVVLLVALILRLI